MKSDILVWNCQCTGHPNFHRCLKEYLREFDPAIVVQFETRVSGIKAEKVVKSIGMKNSHRVEACGFVGGIWVLWKEDITVMVEFDHFSVYSHEDEVS